MKHSLKIVLFVLLLCGVFGADEVKPVMEGDSVTLIPDHTGIQAINKMQWRFGNTLIAQIKGTEISVEDIFRDRLQLDHQTGSMTIKNMRIKHSGLYQLQIYHNSGTKEQKFTVAVYESPSVIEAGETELKSVSVKEGDPVTLHVPQIQGDELIVWRFGDEEKLIAKHDLEAKSSPLCYDEERCRDRLKLDHQTGSLTITNTRTTDSGLYKVKISSKKTTLYKRFTVTVKPGLSPAAVALIAISVLLAAAVAGGVIYYLWPRTTNLPNQTLPVLEGESVTLNPDTKIRTGDEIQWLFGAKETLIAEIKGENREMTPYEGPDMIFMFRLELDKTTGSLIIKFTRTEHTGLYTLKIRRGTETLKKRFHVSVRERTIRALEGDLVTLKTDEEIQTGDEIQWLFGDEDTLIAEIKGENREMTTYEGPDEIFKNRLKLDKTTGSLTIELIFTAHTGLYTLKIRRGRETFNIRFHVYVVVSPISVMERESVTLKPDTKIRTGDEIQWMFGAKETLIAEIKGENREMTPYEGPVMIFKNRLELDKTTGSLIIKFTGTEHTGLYTLKIRRGTETLKKRFHVSVRACPITVMEGDPVTLHPDTEIQTGDEIQWLFEVKDTLIAEIKGENREMTTYRGPYMIFMYRLELDKTTGSLTITDINTEHTGLYTLKIRRGTETLKKKFHVLVTVSYVEVRKGEPVHLYAGLNEIQSGDEIQWMFGDKNSLIAEIKGGTGKTPDERFRDSLELDEKTGDLIIKNSTAEHAGHYKLKIRSSKGNADWTFIVIIMARKKMKEKNDSRENRVNESATVEMPLLNGEDPDVVNEEEEGTSSL